MCGIKKKQASEDKLHSELWFMLQHGLELVSHKESSGSNKQLRMNPENACNFNDRIQSLIGMFVCYGEPDKLILHAATQRASFSSSLTQACARRMVILHEA